MLAYVQPPNEQIKIITNLLRVFCVLTVIMGFFRIHSQENGSSSAIYFASGLFYILSWRGLSYYYCIINQVLNIAIIFNLLNEMAYLIENGMQDSYLSSLGLYKMGCLIFSIVFIYFNFLAYRRFKALALEIYQYEQKAFVNTE